MKALLISSYRLDSVSRTDIAPPLNLLYIAAVLRKSGVASQLLDLNLVLVSGADKANDEQMDTIHAQLVASAPDIVGISCLTTAHFPFMWKVATLARKVLPKTKILLGGVHATLFAREIMENCPEFDYIVMGEGEEQTAELAKAMLNGLVTDLSHIQSLAWRNPYGQVVVNVRKNYIERLDSLPMPAWDLIDFKLYYRDHSNWYNPKRHDIRISIPILSTRSCPYDCNFCSAHETMGRGFRKRTPSNVVDEMAYHVNTFGHRYFGFADDNLTLDKRYVIKVCEEIARRGLDIQFESFNGYNLASLDSEVVDALASVGCIYAILPIEHGSDRIRNEIIGKKLPREKIFEVMSLYKKHHIQTRAMFIMGFPEDTAETLEETRTMVAELTPDMADVFTLIPFPGTNVFRQAIRDRLFIRDIDESMLWAGVLPLNTKGAEFYIKPYAMSLKELTHWRKNFDEMSAGLLARRKK
jgi:anaerobic magnesium-protoporphyrin IX monomethyl ester cyclase